MVDIFIRFFSNFVVYLRLKIVDFIFVKVILVDNSLFFLGIY